MYLLHAVNQARSSEKGRTGFYAGAFCPDTPLTEQGLFLYDGMLRKWIFKMVRFPVEMNVKQVYNKG